MVFYTLLSTYLLITRLCNTIRPNPPSYLPTPSASLYILIWHTNYVPASIIEYPFLLTNPYRPYQRYTPRLLRDVFLCLLLPILSAIPCRFMRKRGLSYLSSKGKPIPYPTSLCIRLIWKSYPIYSISNVAAILVPLWPKEVSLFVKEGKISFVALPNNGQPSYTTREWNGY